MGQGDPGGQHQADLTGDNAVFHKSRSANKRALVRTGEVTKWWGREWSLIGTPQMPAPPIYVGY